MDTLKARVRHGYSRSWVVRKYSLIGLWPSEVHLTRSFFPPHSRLLDIGCGAGRTSIPLAQAGHEVVAMDLATPMVTQTHTLADFTSTRIHGAVADAAVLPFPSNTFDGVLFSYNGIELVPREAGKRAVLAEVFRTLRPGGHFIFTTHAFEAFNQFAQDRLRRALAQLIRTLTFQSHAGDEFGEIVPDPSHNVEVYYMQINSPRKYRSMLRSTGFGLRYFNSRARIDSARPPSWIADFDADFKFYVARKP
jgi:SAM-dependent methyltransferase